MRVVIAEDQVLLADGLARLLAAHEHEVVATVTTGPELIAAVAEHRPDVAVVDIRLPPSFTDEGLRAAVEARRRSGVAILILSQYVETAYARDLLSPAGGTGYLLKDRIGRPREFVQALATVAALTVTGATVEKHINAIFAKLGLPPSDSDHRRVRAVLTYLGV
jgi:DNA-binding NarL/FixJ family response regulator